MAFSLNGMDSMQKNYFLLFWEEYIWKSHRQYRHDLALHPRENLPFRFFLNNLKILSSWFIVIFYLFFKWEKKLPFSNFSCIPNSVWITPIFIHSLRIIYIFSSIQVGHEIIFLFHCWIIHCNLTKIIMMI